MPDIVVNFRREGEVQTLDTGSRVLGDIVLDYTGMPEGERGGNAQRLVASAALYCFSGALAKALSTRGADYTRITGKAELQTALDDKKRNRISGIAITVNVEMPEENAFIFERVEKIMQQGCLITASLEPAFPITYTMNHVFSDD